MNVLPWHLTETAKRFAISRGYNLYDLLGYLDGTISGSFPTAVEALDASYQHGGGWRPFGEGRWELAFDGPTSLENGEVELCYPGDPPMPCIAYAAYPATGEHIYLFESARVAVADEAGNLTSVARMD